MSTTRPRPGQGAPSLPPSRDDHRRFAGRAKRWSVGFTAAGIGLAWALVSQNVVGATNASPGAASGQPAAAPGTTPGVTPHRATIPTTDFFGSGGAQPQPIIGNGGSGGLRPVVRGGTS